MRTTSSGPIGLAIAAPLLVWGLAITPSTAAAQPPDAEVPPAGETRTVVTSDKPVEARPETLENPPSGRPPTPLNPDSFPAEPLPLSVEEQRSPEAVTMGELLTHSYDVATGQETLSDGSLLRPAKVVVVQENSVDGE